MFSLYNAVKSKLVDVHLGILWYFMHLYRDSILTRKNSTNSKLGYLGNLELAKNKGICNAYIKELANSACHANIA